jgi:hypothetical protein
VKEFIINQLKAKKQNGFKTGLYSPEEIDNIFTVRVVVTSIAL